MTSTVGRLLALADLPRRRLALALGLGALALAFGVALPATAGYLISRAAEQPPILSLTTIIVVVRFLALARPLARYLDRLSSHDLALRAIGPLRDIGKDQVAEGDSRYRNSGVRTAADHEPSPRETDHE